MKEVGDALYSRLGDFDIICGIPYGGLPIATYISTSYSKPLIYVRDKEKNYGTNKRIEGEFLSTDRCIIIDDVITSGKSLKETIEFLQDKVNVVASAVVMDRQQNSSLSVISLLNKTDVVKYRIRSLIKSKNSCLCFSADLLDLTKLWSIIHDIGKYMVICKIHYDIVPETERESFKEKMVDLSIEHDFLIMEDRKFNDISYIVEKQYNPFKNWVDLVTVHALIEPSVVTSLSGAVVVATMSNNNYDLTENAMHIASKYSKHVSGFVTQKRLVFPGMLCMTPGIALTNKNIADQKYRKSNDIDTDIKIVGRAIYESTQLLDDVEVISKNISS